MKLEVVISLLLVIMAIIVLTAGFILPEQMLSYVG